MAAASTEYARIDKLSDLRDKLFNYCKKNNSKFINYISPLIDSNDKQYAIFIYNFLVILVSMK
jgi:hypothetical protein